ncbi:hypothetical protein Q5P01_020104 [Channa striata]|uniref:Uncharacterized protein n=1 Tax=Channa striata TaxID=64152 RepID=A0AA88LXQ4_CHASR|nr:hypothetical protein Q5P01_020104 [Channa striata]
MTKMCVIYLGVLMLVLHLSSGAEPNNGTEANPNTTATPTMTTPKSCSGRAEAVLLLAPLALAASLLHTWS